MSNGESLPSYVSFDPSLSQLIISDDNGTMSEGTLTLVVTGTIGNTTVSDVLTITVIVKAGRT